MSELNIETPELVLADEKILAPCSLSLTEGEIHTVLGKSGVGKSQLLKLISQVRQDVSFVFQLPNLFPWLTLFDNLRVSLPQTVSDQDIDRILKRFDLYHQRHLFPSALSVGMQQKGNLARAILSSSKIILMDEPFSSLDYFQKEDVRSFVRDIFNEYKRSVVLVTHDIEEAVFLSKKIFLLQGRPAILSEFGPIKRVENHRFKEVRYQDDFIKSCNLLRESFKC